MASAPATRAAIAKNLMSFDIDEPPMPPDPEIIAKKASKVNSFGADCFDGRCPPKSDSGADLRVTGRYSHQQRICGTITGPLTRYSFANQERQYRLALRPG
jgi:hypothetical protein